MSDWVEKENLVYHCPTNSVIASMQYKLLVPQLQHRVLKGHCLPSTSCAQNWTVGQASSQQHTAFSSSQNSEGKRANICEKTSPQILKTKFYTWSINWPSALVENQNAGYIVRPCQTELLLWQTHSIKPWDPISKRFHLWWIIPHTGLSALPAISLHREEVLGLPQDMTAGWAWLTWGSWGNHLGPLETLELPTSIITQHFTSRQQ